MVLPNAATRINCELEMPGAPMAVPERDIRHLCIGGVRLRIAGDPYARVRLDAQHERFGIGLDEFDIGIKIEWVNELPSRSCKVLFDSGTTWRVYEEGAFFRFDFGSPIQNGEPYKRLIVDRDFRWACLQMRTAYFAAYPEAADPLGYPLDELLIMHRLTQEKAIELHGTGIVRQNGEANLFVGHSGAGKSTTTQLWTVTEDVEVLSDDRIIVRRDKTAPGLETPVQAAGSLSKHEVLRLRNRLALPTGHSAQQDDSGRGASNSGECGMRMYGTPWHGEAMYASPHSALLTRIFVLEHGYGNVITPLTASQAVAELFARSFVPFHRHEYVDSALAFLEELVNAVPVYRYAFEPDQRAIDKIIHFHD
jgi:hypothetical protein